MNVLNKRKSTRYTCAVPVESAEGAVLDQSATIDISKGGIGFVSHTAIPLNKQIAVEIELTPGGDPILVIGQVRWVSAIGGSGRFRVGISFDEVLHGSKSRLEKFFRK